MGETYDYESLGELAKELGRPVDTLVAQSRVRDPFYISPARKASAEWFAEQWSRHQFGRGTHLRRIHYRLLSQDTPVIMWMGKPYINDDGCWGDLCRSSLDARLLGLVPYEHFIDRRTQEPLVYFATDAEASSVVVSSGMLGLSDITPDLPKLEAVPPTIRQNYMVELWVEKSTINDIVEPLHHEYNINIMTGVGEMSDIRCRDLIDRALRDGRPVRVLYVSDFDPGGQSMPVAVARKLEYRIRTEGLELDLELIPILLTHQQCIDYRLPRVDLKSTDPRKAAFEERFGEGGTELDALEALHPGETERIIREEIERYYDMTLDDRIDEIVEELQRDMDDVNNDIHDMYAEEYAELSRDYRLLTERYNKELRVLSEKFDLYQQGVKNLLNQATPDPMDYEWPEPEEAEEHDNPLYASERDYLEQIDCYKAFQRKPIARKESANLGRRRGSYKPKQGLSPKPWHSLQVGDSFSLDIGEDSPAYRARIYHWAKKNGQVITFKMKNGQLTIMRQS